MTSRNEYITDYRILDEARKANGLYDLVRTYVKESDEFIQGKHSSASSILAGYLLAIAGTRIRTAVEEFKSITGETISLGEPSKNDTPTVRKTRKALGRLAAKGS